MYFQSIRKELQSNMSSTSNISKTTAFDFTTKEELKTLPEIKENIITIEDYDSYDFSETKKSEEENEFEKEDSLDRAIYWMKDIYKEKESMNITNIQLGNNPMDICAFLGISPFTKDGKKRKIPDDVIINCEKLREMVDNEKIKTYISLNYMLDSLNEPKKQESTYEISPHFEMYIDNCLGSLCEVNERLKYE